MVDSGAATSQYIFDNESPEAAARFGSLAALYDDATIRHLQSRGIAPGWHCLEVGGGGGSIALWLSESAGPSSRVVVTDIDTRYLESLKHPHLEVLRHDITRDPMPAGSFDLIHTRLVLVHLPQRDDVIRRLVGALKPGGWLVLEELDARSLPPDPSLGSGEQELKTFLAMQAVLKARGVDTSFSRGLASILAEKGLTDVDQEGRVVMWRGAARGAELLRANFEQVHEAMVGGGLVTEEEYAADLGRLDDPLFVRPAWIMWTAWGRLPR